MVMGLMKPGTPQHLHACDLDQDIASFPDGDLSIVGSKGFNLSGGQRQWLVSLTVPKHLIC